MKVYHGSTRRIPAPLAKAGRPNLDFGRGFYVTDIRKQAEDWAVRMALRTFGTPMLNIYELDIDLLRFKYRILTFKDYDKAWLDFIVASRSGQTPWVGYDMVEGGVADDRVIDTVEAYMIGNMTLEMALGQLAQHLPNNQICLISQNAIDECVRFLDVEPLILR